MEKLPSLKNGFTLIRTTFGENRAFRRLNGRNPFGGNLVSVKRGFTLIELLIVMAILGILATIALTSFQTSQQRARDGQRKSDLKQVSNALELYYADHGLYPSANRGGQILGCPSTSSTPCTWGAVASGSEFTDGNTVYLSRIPQDPRGGTYFYRVLNNRQAYQIFARLENLEDKDCIPNSSGDPVCRPASGTFPDCISGVCNFAVTSTNVNPYDR